MKRILKSVLKWIFGPSTDEIVAEFRQRFPGKCLICSFHAFGYANGHTSDPVPPPHQCNEKQM